MTFRWLWLLVVTIAFFPFAQCTNEKVKTGDIYHGNYKRRVKRDFVWNSMTIEEEQKTALPHFVGQLQANETNKDVAKFAIDGEGANTTFKVNEENGEIYCFEMLDREKKAQYRLSAILVNKYTGKTLGPKSIFTIRVRDINDNAPIFTKNIYNASVPEMSPTGTLVTTVTALDADDPTLAGHAKVAYQITKGQDHFTINNMGSIYTAVPYLDREEKATYEITVEARDVPGQKNGHTSTATIMIHLIDINDNFPTFIKDKFTFNVYENLRVMGEVGRLQVVDIDEPQNRNTKYVFGSEKLQEIFEIRTNAQSNEGIFVLKKALDFESVKQYKMNIQAIDPSIVLAVAKHHRPKSNAEVIINVLDVDEPPVFKMSPYKFEIKEDTKLNKIVGSVFAEDPDEAKNSVRYSLRNPKDNFFIISNKGDIIVDKPLDRETNNWHNLTVAAEEIDPKSTMKKESLVPIFIKVLDVNDNAPEFAERYAARVCENAPPGKVIIRISAVDKDEMTPGAKFTYYSAEKENNFTVQDNKNNTASVLVKYGEFNLDLAKVHYLPIVISDNGKPEMSSTNTLTIGVCKCNEKGEYTYCEEVAKQAAVSGPMLAIIFVCLIVLLLVAIIFILRKTQKTKTNILGKNVAEIHEQLVTYDEEGGGEMDTNSYDVSVLNSVRRNVVRQKSEKEPRPMAYPQLQIPANNGDMSYVIEVKKDEADNDGEGLPYDTLHIFGYEGSESIVESLSSLESGSSDSDIDYDVLNDWGPRFKMLADLYGLEQLEDFPY
ncbi:cadherin-5 [Pelobates cultripes]|uniref:Cadherin-5 n=1 Tax=Pelobates cultripes TaxID=61616 RepID=A0AAD1WVJ5_PELCU|nr:cadherin-5 [Pelobates cultripes]